MQLRPQMSMVNPSGVMQCRCIHIKSQYPRRPVRSGVLDVRRPSIRSSSGRCTRNVLRRPRAIEISPIACGIMPPLVLGAVQCGVRNQGAPPTAVQLNLAKVGVVHDIFGLLTRIGPGFEVEDGDGFTTVRENLRGQIRANGLPDHHASFDGGGVRSHAQRALSRENDVVLVVSRVGMQSGGCATGRYFHDHDVQAAKTEVGEQHPIPGRIIVCVPFQGTVGVLLSNIL